MFYVSDALLHFETTGWVCDSGVENQDQIDPCKIRGEMSKMFYQFYQISTGPISDSLHLWRHSDSEIGVCLSKKTCDGNSSVHPRTRFNFCIVRY